MAYEVTFYWGDCKFTNIIVSGHSEASLQDFYRKKNYDLVEVRELDQLEYNKAVKSGRPVVDID